MLNPWVLILSETRLDDIIIIIKAHLKEHFTNFMHAFTCPLLWWWYDDLKGIFSADLFEESDMKFVPASEKFFFGSPNFAEMILVLFTRSSILRL